MGALGWGVRGLAGWGVRREGAQLRACAARPPPTSHPLSLHPPRPHVVESAHAAFIKAAQYFNIRLVKLAVGSDYRLGGAAVRRALGPNTVLVVASAPGFPHGVVDHVQEIAKVGSWVGGGLGGGGHSDEERAL